LPSCPLEAGVAPPIRDIDIRQVTRLCWKIFVSALQLLHTGYKAIPAPRNRQDVMRFMVVFVEGLAQGGDVADQVVLLYYRIGPDLSQELIFLYHPPSMTDQKEQ